MCEIVQFDSTDFSWTGNEQKYVLALFLILVTLEFYLLKLLVRSPSHISTVQHRN